MTHPHGGDVDVVPGRGGLKQAAAGFLLGTVLLAGCGEPPIPTSIEVYLEAGTVPQDGQREKHGTCPAVDPAYIAHLQLLAGNVTVTVTDPIGQTTRLHYDAAQGDPRTLDGPDVAGNWTLEISWTGFAGNLHVGITC